MQQIERRHPVDIRQPLVGASVEIHARHQFQQAMMRAISDRNRQWQFIKRVDIAADDGAEQPAQSALLGVSLAEIVEFLLESAEGPQAVVLLRKPRMQVVHNCLFNQEKKLPSSIVEGAAEQMLFLQMSVTIFAAAGMCHFGYGALGAAGEG
jgi:hypothetical protein